MICKEFGIERLGVDEKFVRMEEFGGNYFISNYGRIYSIKRWTIASNGMKHFTPGGLMKTHSKRSSKYVNINFGNKSRSLHRLVAKYFVDKPHGCNTVNHLDLDKKNNKYNNLQWTTSQGNNRHAIESGARKCLNLQDKEYIREYVSVNGRNIKSHTFLSKMYGVTKTTIRSIGKGAY